VKLLDVWTSRVEVQTHPCFLIFELDVNFGAAAHNSIPVNIFCYFTAFKGVGDSPFERHAIKQHLLISRSNYLLVAINFHNCIIEQRRLITCTSIGGKIGKRAVVVVLLVELEVEQQAWIATRGFVEELGVFVYLQVFEVLDSEDVPVKVWSDVHVFLICQKVGRWSMSYKGTFSWNDSFMFVFNETWEVVFAVFGLQPYPLTSRKLHLDFNFGVVKVVNCKEVTGVFEESKRHDFVVSEKNFVTISTNEASIFQDFDFVLSAAQFLAVDPHF
jgi:hypothetical protein